MALGTNQIQYFFILLRTIRSDLESVDWEARILWSHDNVMWPIQCSKVINAEFYLLISQPGGPIIDLKTKFFLSKK